jgi:GNAT superfamily N-acetyltransferase
MNFLSSETQVLIRQIEPDDAAEVSLLVRQLGYERPANAVREWIKKLDPKRNSQTAFVACLEAELVGWIEVSIERRLQSAPYALIGGLVVKDGSRNHGIGRQLCERAEAWAWQHGADTVRVTSRNTRLDAHRFYLRDGYAAVKTSMVFEKNRPK